MVTTQYLFPYPGTVTVNYEYTVTLSPGQALRIDWFPGAALTLHFQDRTYHVTEATAPRQPDGTHLIKLTLPENRYDLPLRLARGDYLVADNVVINQRTREYFTADQLDLLPDELVAAHGDKVTRVLFSGEKTATEHYVKK